MDVRAIWSGAVSFGLVTVPVKLYPATSPKDIKLNYLHVACGTPVRYRKHCPTCGKDLEPDEVALGYEYEKDRYVMLSEEELDALPQLQARTVEILAFVQAPEIDPVYYDRSYYLEPTELGRRAYGLLLSAMSKAGKVALARTAIRSKSTLACLRPAGRALVMHTMHWPDEIRSVEELAGLAPDASLAAAPQARELDMAMILIDNLSAPFRPEAYKDEARAAMLELIQRKIQGEEVAVRPAPQPTRVLDLVKALEASIAATAGGGAGASRAAGQAGQAGRA